MRILQVHNFYQHHGGEDSVVSSECSLLCQYGHDCRLYSVNNNSITGAVSKIKATLSVAYSFQSKADLFRELTKHRPDVVHVHNFFPLLTPSIFDACKQEAVPVVLTLHNFRLICPGALLMRDGKICEKCIDRFPYRSVLYGCYRKSRLGTLAVARMVAMHQMLDTWHTKVDCFIALTEFARSKFVAAGFPANKIVIKPNFVGLNVATATRAKRSGALFVGRLSQEKGIMSLLNAWKGINQTLRIIGEGPLLDEVRERHRENVVLLGRKAMPDVLELMASSQFLVMPSECYETFGMVIIEAFACGLPVIAPRLGGMAEIIEDGITGLLFAPGDVGDLAAKVRWAFDHPEDMQKMGVYARKVSEGKFSSEANYLQLMAIYERVISARSLDQNLRYKDNYVDQNG
jgi:glycosyltransferase involved in cell wall biosynthesis